MSDDIIDRLRYEYGFGDRLEAADEITRLRAENEKLQRKLHDAIVKYQRLLMQYEPEKAAGLASAALKETGDD